MNAVQLQQSVRDYAESIGIDKIGFTTAAPFRELKNRLKRQQELGYQSGFEEKDLDKRTEPALLARSSRKYHCNCCSLSIQNGRFTERKKR